MENEVIIYPADALARRLTEAGQSVVQAGVELSAGPHQRRIAGQLAGDTAHGTDRLVGIGVQVTLDGRDLPTLCAGWIGTGTTRDEALRAASEVWCRQLGDPLIGALFPDAASEGTLYGGACRIVPGSARVRGGSAERLDESLTLLDDAVRRFVELELLREAGPGWHGLTVAVAVNTLQGVSVLCQIDGRESLALNRSVDALPWPMDAGYLLQRFYLVAPCK